MNWTFLPALPQKSFRMLRFAPDGFLILCKDSAVNLFQPHGQRSGFSLCFSADNTGTSLVLRDNLGNIVHSVSYSDTWIRMDKTKWRLVARADRSERSLRWKSKLESFVE